VGERNARVRRLFRLRVFADHLDEAPQRDGAHDILGTVDRATLGKTVIKQGTKIDNMVHVAHNVTIGAHCLLAAQVGIAGSCTLGDYVVLGGQVGVGDHVSIGDRVMVSGGTAVIKDTEPGQVLGGYYAMPHRDWLRVQAVLPKLPELKRQIAELERQVNELKQKGEKS